MGVLHDSNWPVEVQHIIIILGILEILGIQQNIICQFLVWIVSLKFSPSKILYCTVLCIHFILSMYSRVQKSQHFVIIISFKVNIQHILLR